MSDQKDKKEIKKKVEQIYENFGLDMEDMDTEELERIVDYYDNNKKQLEKDFKSSLKTKKILSDAEQVEEESCE
jgi:hypothetical protein